MHPLFAIHLRVRVIFYVTIKHTSKLFIYFNEERWVYFTSILTEEESRFPDINYSD